MVASLEFFCLNSNKPTSIVLELHNRNGPNEECVAYLNEDKNSRMQNEDVKEQHDEDVEDQHDEDVEDQHDEDVKDQRDEDIKDLQCSRQGKSEGHCALLFFSSALLFSLAPF